MIHRWHLCVLIILCQFQLLTAQYRSADSIEKLLRTELSDSERAKLTYEISRDLVYVNPNQAMAYAMESRDLAIKLGSKRDEAYAYRIIASIYGSQGLYSLTTDYLTQATNIFEELRDADGLANTDITWGNMFRLQGLHEKSADFHRKSHLYFKTNGPEHRYAVTCLNYGEALYYLDSLNKAKKKLYQAVRLNDKLSHFQNQTFTFKALGLVHYKEGQLDSAVHYFKSALTISDRMGERSQKQATMESYINLASVHEAKGEVSLEIETLDKAEKFGKTYRLPIDLMPVYLRKLEIYNAANDKDKSSKYLALYTSLKDSLDNSYKQEKENIINTAVNSLRLTIENKYLSQEKQFSERVIKEQRTYIIIMGVLALIAIISVVVTLLSLRKLRQSNELLQEQKNQISNKSEELEELNATKDKMFSIISHDLRSPLHTLVGFADLVVNHYQSMSKEEIGEMMAQLRTNVDATLKMTDNLIEWGKLQMQQGRTNPIQFELGELINGMIEVYQAAASQKKITLKINEVEEVQVYADYNQVEVIIRNLLNNAIKFSSEGDEVNLSVFQENDMWVTQISDTGRGMSEDEMHHLFELNTRSKQGTAGEKGSGLGLVLCYEYAQNNNGKLTVSSEVDKGTTFKLYLPRA